ncbi:hypothetical protein tb265_26130 [Gemmatimonadetes bacterium T265]|nr:hypothetical protein tb265_26130 [Gemmatimonadetes bacterium T265]
MPVLPSPRRVAPLTVLALAACAGPLPTSFASPAAARAGATDLFTSLADRFTNVARAPRFETARQKLSRSALSPSGVYDDDAVWTSTTPEGAHVLEVEAAVVDGQYRFTPRAAPPFPDRLGDGRHVIRLARAADGSYQWATSVEHNVGRFRAAAGPEVFTTGLARFEQPAPAVRAELQTTFPRTTAALGRLFSLDDVQTATVGDGTTRVDLRLGVRPERLRAAGLPAFARYVDKYVGGTRWSMALEDGRGARWADLRSAGGTLQLRLRLRDGQLQTLDGAPRPLPENVLLRSDAFTKVLLFETGAEQLVGDLTFVRTGRERGWSVHWRRPPRWHIPLGMRHLINGALNRPFTGAGMHLALTLRDPAAGAGPSAGPTLLVREFETSVEESTLVRWFGSIGARAMSDLDARVESEEDRFFADVLRALRADVDAAYTR